MNALAQSFRKQASELHEEAMLMLKASDLNVDAAKQVQATAGLVAAKQFTALADLVDYLKASDKLDTKTEQRNAMLDKMAAIRAAAASATNNGDWSEFDRLAEIGGEGKSPREPGDD